MTAAVGGGGWSEVVWGEGGTRMYHTGVTLSYCHAVKMTRRADINDMKPGESRRLTTKEDVGGRRQI